WGKLAYHYSIRCCPGFAHLEHSLELLPRDAKKRRHLFKLFSPGIIRRSRAKPLDPGGEIHTLHVLWRSVSSGTATVRLLEHTKFTQRHGGVSFRILVGLKIIRNYCGQEKILVAESSDR